MTSSQICLKWNSFLSNIATSFENLWAEEGLVDVTLASDGQCLTAHKIVLCASSPFFKKLFQTNPCQHPVVILQDVRFTELEAILTFIYKGEVNIDQEKLPALLKAAETFQIRGLCGGDLTKDLYKRSYDQEENNSSNSLSTSEEAPKKKRHKSNKNQFHEETIIPESHCNVIGETSQQSDLSLIAEQSITDNDAAYQQLQMKLEPFEIEVEQLSRNVENSKNVHEQLDTGQNTDEEERDIGSVGEELSAVSGLTDDKPLIYSYQQLPYADMLPAPDVISSWAQSRPMDHLACDLMKILFTAEERINSNVNGKMGKKQFDANKIHLIRAVLLQFSGIQPNSIEWEEIWKNCVIKIDTSNRGLKRYLFQRRSVYSK